MTKLLQCNPFPNSFPLFNASMKNTHDETLSDTLRQKAMEILRNKPTKSNQFLEVDALKLVHELEVSHVELEIQNEELTIAHLAVQNAIDLYDFAPIGCFTLSMEGKIIDLNLKGASLLEKERCLLKESIFGAYVADESKPTFNSFLQNVHNNSTKETCEIKLLTTSGIQVYLYLTGNISKDKEQCLVTAMDITDLKQKEATLQQERELYLDIVNHQPAGIYRETFRDITERKKAEQALRDSEEIYRNLVLRIPDGVYKSTTEGKFIDVNPAMVKMLGYESREDLMNIDIKKQLYFDLADRESLALNKTFEETGIYKLKKKDGTAIWVEDHGWYNLDKDGNVEIHEGVLRDVSERKLAEEALKESELILKKTLIESTGLIDKTTESINYEKISDTILEISGAKYVSFNINKEDGELLTVSLSGIKENILKASSYFGFEVINKTWKADPIRKERIKDQTITKFQTLSDLSSYSIPKSVSTLLEKVFNLGEAIVISINKNDVTIGDFTLIYSKGETLHNNELVLLFANQVGLFIERENVNKEIRESEEKYRYLFDNNPQPMYIYDVETLVFLEVNQALIDHYGYSKKEFLQMSLKDIRPQEDIKTLLIEVLKKRENLKPAGVWRHIKKNGEIIFVDLTIFSIILNGKDARHVMIQDITERKKTEKALKESEDKYRTMIENSNDLIWTLDAQGNFTYINDIALQTSSLGLEDWKGKSLVPLIVNEDLSILHDVFQRAMNGETCNYKIRLKVTDKKIVTLLVNTSPIYISDKIEGVLSFGRDITEINRTLGLLKDSEEKFRSIADQTNDLISITDLNGILIYVSPASKSIFLYEPEEMCGHNYIEFMNVESISTSKTAFRKSIVTGESVNNLELKMKRKDGTTFYGELNGSNFKYGDNYGSLGIIRDMTKQKKAQEELEEKMNELMRFQNLTVGRELTMIELKKEVNKLLIKTGEEEKYKIVK